MDNGDMMLPGGFWRSSWRPPTEEKTETTIVTQVVILLLQGLVLMALLGVGMALAFAAQQAWGVEDSAPALCIVGGVALYITLSWLADKMWDYDPTERLAGLVLALAAVGLVMWGAWSVMQKEESLDVAIMQALACSLLVILALVLGIVMTIEASLKAGMIFLVIPSVGALMAYFVMPHLAQQRIWPWLLTCGAVAFNYGAHFTGRAFKAEIKDPFERGTPPSEKYKADYIKFLIEQQREAHQPPEAERPIVVTITEGGMMKMLLPGLSGTNEDKRTYARAAVDDKLALDKTLPRTHPLWRETHERGLVEWRDPDDHNQGQKATYAGKHVFARLLEEL